MPRNILACLLFLSWACLIATAEDELAQQNNLFSKKLFNRISPKNTNFVCSPLSVAVGLSMLLNGARAETASGIRSALGYDNSTDIIRGYADLIPRLQSSGNYQLSLANSIWIQNGFPVEDNYRELMMDVFSSDANTFVDSNSAVDQINSWVSSHTNNKIPKLFNSLIPPPVMVLVNAIYFQGNWTSQFNARATKRENFNNGKSNVRVPFMKQQNRFQYGESHKLQSKILHLPYKGGNTILTIVLPNTVSNNLNAIITHADFQTEVFQDFSIYEIDVKIPRFKIESTIGLNLPLKDLGMRKAFSNRAEFAGISTKVGVKISKAVQKAIIDVNERGSEAAAATGIVAVESDYLEPIEIKEFHADHPFIFAIYHKPTKSILFLGSYYGGKKRSASKRIA